jgi:transposase
MDVVVAKGCGLDVHRDTVVACIQLGDPGRKVHSETRVFGTVKRDLEALVAWLSEAGVTHVAMESTGVYWMPVYAVLEDRFTVVVGNAHHMKNVPGRKTDAKDCEWIASLLRHGLIASSFVLPKDLRGLRELVRQRRALMHTQASFRNRLVRTLEQADIKLASFISDVFGVSGRAFVRAIIAGSYDPAKVAQLAKGHLRRKLQDLALALDGNVTDEHRFLLKMQLDLVETSEAHIAALDVEIEKRLKPYAEEVALLRTIPGVDKVAAAAIIGEMGVDMSVFRSQRAAAAWAGVCPGNNRSAGRTRDERTRQGNRHLTTVLVQAAASATRKKGSFIQAKYYRLKARRGPKRALMALAHKLLIAAYHMLRNRVPYRELGCAYLDNLHRGHTIKGMQKRLEAMGLVVDIHERPAT